MHQHSTSKSSSNTLNKTAIVKVVFIQRFKDSIKIVHFIGAQKPWYYTYNLDTSSVTGNTRLNEVEYLNSWWSLFAQTVLPSLNDETVSSAFFKQGPF